MRPFYVSLQDLEKQNPNFRFIPTMTEMAKSQQQWGGERDFINQDTIVQHLSSLQGHIYYLAGPPEMVGAMRRILTAAGADEDDIRTEEFSGY